MDNENYKQNKTDGMESLISYYGSSTAYLNIFENIFFL